jgi:hypothetical protein
MRLDDTQRRVAIGMAVAMATALTAFVIAAMAAPRAWTVERDVAQRLTLVACSLLGPALVLFVCIARLAKHRFFTPADIDGSALTVGTERARLLQALLQNTLEQVCLAVPAYFAAGVLAPAGLLSLVPTAAVLFVIGRMAFFAGYARGAPARAFGFALTFYPTALMLIATVAIAVAKALR